MLMMLPLMLVAQSDDWTPPQFPTCSVTHATVFYDRFKDMPKDIQADVLKQGAIADKGEPYEQYDVIRHGDWPRRAFVRGGQSNGKYFVWIDQGGFVRYNRVLGYEPVYRKTNEAPTLVRFADLQGEPCAAINAFLDGVITIYSRD